MQGVKLLSVNPFVRIMMDENISIDLLLDGKSFVFSDNRIVLLLSSLGEQAEIDEIIKLTQSFFKCSEKKANNMIMELVNKKILVNKNDYSDDIQGVNHWIDRNWLDALIFHLKTRNLNYCDKGSSDSDYSKNKVLEKQIKNNEINLWKDIKNKKKIQLQWDIEDDCLNRSFEEVLLSRRSNTRFKGNTIRFSHLSYIMKYSNAELRMIRKEVEKNIEKKPIYFLHSSFIANESYLLVHNVEGVKPGFYHYCPKSNSLTVIMEGDFRDLAQRLCVGQERAKNAGVLVLITAVWERYMMRYKHPRAYRNLLINTAEMGQKYLLASTIFGLSTFMTPAFAVRVAYDELGFKVFEEDVLYAIGFG